jgi:hypothetical protein
MKNVILVTLALCLTMGTLMQLSAQSSGDNRLPPDLVVGAILSVYGGDFREIAPGTGPAMVQVNEIHGHWLKVSTVSSRPSILWVNADRISLVTISLPK